MPDPIQPIPTADFRTIPGNPEFRARLQPHCRVHCPTVGVFVQSAVTTALSPERTSHHAGERNAVHATAIDIRGRGFQSESPSLNSRYPVRPCGPAVRLVKANRNGSGLRPPIDRKIHLLGLKGRKRYGATKTARRPVSMNQWRCRAIVGPRSKRRGVPARRVPRRGQRQAQRARSTPPKNGPSGSLQSRARTEPRIRQSRSGAGQ